MIGKTVYPWGHWKPAKVLTVNTLTKYHNEREVILSVIFEDGRKIKLNIDCTEDNPTKYSFIDALNQANKWEGKIKREPSNDWLDYKNGLEVRAEDTNSNDWVVDAPKGPWY